VHAIVGAEQETAVQTPEDPPKAARWRQIGELVRLTVPQVDGPKLLCELSRLSPQEVQVIADDAVRAAEGHLDIAQERRAARCAVAAP
jgi:hypothetical protein